MRPAGTARPSEPRTQSGVADRRRRTESVRIPRNPYYEEHPPDPSLRRHVECAWWIQSESPIVDHPVPPDGCLDIIYSPAGGVRAIGTMTKEQRHDFPAGDFGVGIRFRPGMAASFLHEAPSTLTDSSVALEYLWGADARRIEASLRESPTARECAQLLLAAIRGPEPPIDSVHRAIEAIAAARGNVDLDYIARQANLSPRQFRRRCLEESGLTPKHLCRVLRFREASRLAALERIANWSAIAADTGYFDQSHLIRDFRDFTGRPPLAVHSRTCG